jgi:hypothetical protein
MERHFSSGWLSAGVVNTPAPAALAVVGLEGVIELGAPRASEETAAFARPLSVYTVAEGVLFTFLRVDHRMAKRRNRLREHRPFTLGKLR